MGLETVGGMSVIPKHVPFVLNLGADKSLAGGLCEHPFMTGSVVMFMRISMPVYIGIYRIAVVLQHRFAFSSFPGGT